MKLKNYISFLIAFLLSYYCVLHAQEKTELSSSDKKKIEKAEKELKKAEEKYKEADKIYAEVVEKQSELTAEESDKLNNKAMAKQIESISMEFKAKSAKYDVYALRVELFWVKNPTYIESMRYAHSLDNDARNDYSTANELFKEQSGVSDNLMRLGKISDAKDFINKALEKMMQAFELCSNPSLAEAAPVAQPDPVPAPADTVPVDTTIVIQQTSMQPAPADTIVSISNPESMQVSEPAPVQEIIESAPRVSDSVPVIVTTPVEAPATVQPLPESTPEPAIAESPAFDAQSVSAPIQESYSEESFKVQIAASRVPLNTQQLLEIYSGPETPEEKLINDWYKYTIGSFSDYQSANSLKDACGVEGAFVVNP